MAALAEIGVVLERFGQRLQSKEVPREPVTPYEHARRLWETVAPGRKLDPVESVFLHFSFAQSGVQPEGREQNIFTYLLGPYRSLFPELDIFTVSLSMSHESDDISFKLAVFAPPPSPQLNQDKPYPILVVRELPEQRDYDPRIPYNLLILADDQLCTGKLSRELVGFDQEAGLLWQGWEKWHEGSQGDIDWRRQFTSEALRLLTKIADTNRDYLSTFNREVQTHFRRQEKSISWWHRSWWDRLHPGAVWPESLELYHIRAELIGPSTF